MSTWPSMYLTKDLAKEAAQLGSKTRSTRHSQGSQAGLADQAAKLSFASAESLETMSEAELPLGFNRMNRFRQSLPLSRSTSQTKLRSPGVLFLQFGDESRRVHITHEISSMDTLHALIVHMFPQKLTMGMLKSSNTAILIKDESRNVFYELEDVRDIQDRSIIKIFRKEPLYASFPGAHMANGDLRRDMVYTARDSSPTRRLNSMSPASHLTSGSPPPVLQSSSPARSRMSYSGGRPPSFAGSPVHHSERHSNLPPAQGVSPSPSAILERRDVKPDEDLANKNVVMVKNEGVYADPYGMVHEGRLSISSTQSLAGMGDPFSYPGGLYKRGSVRSLSTYSAAALQSELEDSLYKPNAQMYGDPYGPGMGFRMPPSSPQKMTDGRMVDVQQGQSPHSTYSGPSSRSSPVRQSFRKDSSSSVFMDSPVNKTRNSSSSGPPEIFPGPGERPLSGFSSPVPTKEVETRERMEAMEKQIASLTGLVQSALFRGSDGENPSEKPEPANGAAPTTGSVSHSNRNSMATPASTPTPTQASTASAAQQTVITRLHMQLHLHGLQQNTSELRNQLQQLKKMQLQNQETVKTMLKRTETEISVRVTDTMRKQEDPLQRQRALVEEERLKYLNEEELITQQLNDLEKSVEKIKKDLSHSHQLISVQELEEKGLVLQQLGETLTDLKAHFPSLQSKMRVILRVEVEAVKFLKEEPHRLDTLLKRCRSVTDTLAQIQRQVEEGVWNPTDNLHNQSPKQVMAESEFAKTSDFEFPTSPPMNFHELTASQTSSWESGYNQSSSGNQTNPQRSHNPSRAGEMVAVKTQTGPEVPSKRMSADKSVSVEAAERDWEEKRAALTQYSAKDINRLLEETQAELMKAIPDLEFAAKHKQSGSTTSTPEHKPTKPQHMSKGTTKIDPSGRRGSEELTVPRYRTEKPSKSPPPPPPRRSFPSSHGITTARTGEVIVTSKKEATYIKKADSEELETQKPQVKLRRTVSEVARPASTPPIIASGIKDDDDEDRIIAELEVFQRSSGSPFIPQFHCDRLTTAVSPSPVDLWPHEATVAAKGWKDWESSRSPTRGTFCLPQIVLSEWVSNPPSPTETAHEVAKGLCSLKHRDSRLEVTDKKDMDEEGSAGPCSGNHLKSDTFDIKENPLQLELGSENAGSCETVRCCEELHGSFASSSSKQPSIEPQSLPSLQYMEASELHIDVRAIQNKDDNPAEDIKAFIITMSEIQALSNTEVHELLEAKGQDVDTLNIDITHGQDWAEIRSQEPFVRLPNKPLLLIFDESLELRTSYRILSSVLEEDQECRASLGLQREGDGPGPKIEVVTLKENHPMCMEADGGYLKPTGVGHPEDTTCFSSQKQPVPKPRTFQGKDLKLHLSKPCRVQVSKLHCSALSQAIQSGATSTNRILKVISEQGQKYFHMDENEAQPRNQEQNLPEKTTEMFPALSETSSLCTAAPRRGAIGSTYQRLDSLEDTIRALELTLSEISEYQSPDFVFPHGFHGAHQLGTVSAGDEVPEVLKRWGASEEGTVAVEPPPMKPQQGKVNGSKKCQPPKEKPPLLPKPQVAAPQSGGVSIPAMKMVNPAASRLKVAQQQGSPDKSKHIKQRMEYMRIQGQQQAAKPSKEASGVNETSNPGSEKSSPGRTSIPVLTSFGTRNSSISF